MFLSSLVVLRKPNSVLSCLLISIIEPFVGRVVCVVRVVVARKRTIDLRVSSGSKLVDEVNFHYGMVEHDQVPAVFNKIVSVPELEAALAEALEIVVAELMTRARQFTTGQQLRVFLFLFSVRVLSVGLFGTSEEKKHAKQQ